MKLKFIGRKKYTTGTIDISEPWKSSTGKDIFIYELYSEKNDSLKNTIEIIDEAIDGNKIKHINIISQTINAVNKLTEKENIYDNLSQEQKDMINKFKELYKYK